MNDGTTIADADIARLIDLAKTSDKLEPMLRAGVATPGAASATYGEAGAVVRGDLVALDILLADGVTSAAAAAALAAAGMSGVSVIGRAASGWIAADAVAQLDAVAEVQFARATYGYAHAGSVGEEGSLAINADAGRAEFGVDGSGVVVGVLSDSFNARGGAAADVASGDLGAVEVLLDSSGSDEGRAMLQIVHDVAPGAGLMFHTASGGQANFAEGILALALAGADVIVDDIVYLAEPFFQDGLVSRAIDAVAEAGVAYFSSAGNAGRDSYEAAFAGSGQNLVLQGSRGPIDFGEMHDFDTGDGVDVRQRVIIPQGGDIFLTFQWDQPFASVSSNGRGSASDLDILLFGGGGALETSNLAAFSASFNIGGDPVEVFRFVNTTSTTQFDLVISHFAGPEAGLLKYIDLGSARIAEHATFSDTSFGHAPAEGGMGVGAAFWGFTPNNGIDAPRLESFSSAGPATVLFDDAGVRLSEPETRASPDIVGPDGTNTTFFGFDTGFDADTAPNFFGTSAAAPHVAAVAALMLEANPNLTPTELYDALRATAIDMGAAGFDGASGFGLVDAAAALGAILPPPAKESAPVADAAISLVGSDGDDVLIGGAGADRLDGGLGADLMNGGLGDDIYIVDEAGDRIVESGGVDTVIASIDFALAQDLENLSLTGAARVGSGNRLDNILQGGVGDDTLKGGAGLDRLEGGAGDDILRGHDDADMLFGGAGADFLDGGAGADVMAGGLGDDVYIVDDLGDVIEEAADGGFDTVLARISINLPHEVEVLRFIGGANVDASGNGGDNRFIGNDGANIFKAGGGDDRLIGGGGDDVLIGHGGLDRLDGGVGDDLLLGRADDDLLIGGAGADRLGGGAGADIFRFAPGDGVDQVLDFEVGVDFIQAVGFGFASGADVLALTLDEAFGASLRFADGGVVQLLGVHLADLDASAFLV